jgi:hypothetical protein
MQVISECDHAPPNYHFTVGFEGFYARDDGFPITVDSINSIAVMVPAIDAESYPIIFV